MICAPQNVHGPSPSRTQMILPQERQLGAASSSSWRCAWQLHLRDAVVRVGFVLSSSARSTESIVEISAVTPRIGVPPVVVILVAFALAARVLMLIRSEVSVPLVAAGLEAAAFGAVEFDVDVDSGAGVLLRDGTADPGVDDGRDPFDPPV